MAGNQQVNDIVVRYVADIQDLSKGSEQAAQTIQKGVTAPTNAMRKTVGEASEKVKSSFMAMGQAARIFGQMTGDTKAQVITMAAESIMQLGLMADSVKLLAVAWKASLVAAVAAAGFALGNWIAQMTSGTAEIQRQISMLAAGNVIAKEIDTIVQVGTGAIKEYAAGWQELVIRQNLFGESSASAEKQFELVKNAIVKLDTAIVALRDRYLEMSQAEQAGAFGQMTLAKINTLDADLVKLLATYDRLKTEIFGNATIGTQPTFKFKPDIEADEQAFRAAMAPLVLAADQAWESMKAGFSGALAQMAIYGKSFGETMTGVFAASAQAAIKFSLDMFFQIISNTITMIITGCIAAYAYIPFIGLALGLAAAAGSIGAARAMAGKQGGTSFAEGGFIPRPMLAVIGDAPGGEYVFNSGQFDKLLASRGGGEHGHEIYLDGRKVGDALFPLLPWAVRKRGVKL